MKNPILQTINNTLHIKADNLEPIEVDSSCSNDFYDIAQRNYIGNLGHLHPQWHEDIRKGINIQQLADRIEVRNGIIDLGLEGKYDDQTPKAFLLPSKEDKIIKFSLNDKPSTEDLKEWASTKDFNWKDATNEEIKSEALPSLTAKYGIQKSYTIEEIEKAIDSLGKNWKMPKIKEAIINNLKK